MIPTHAPPLSPLHCTYLFVGLLLAGGVLVRRAPASWRIFPYLSAALFLALYLGFAPGNSLVHLGLLGACGLAFFLVRDRPLSGMFVVFTALFAYDLLAPFAELTAPRGFSYLLFRMYDSLVGPAVRLTRLLMQTFAFPTLLAGPIVLKGDFRLPGRIDFRRAAFLLAAGLVKIHVLLPLVEIHFQTGLLTPLSWTWFSIKNFWAAGLYGYVRLFLDFSGYTDIIVGLCVLLGLRIRHNFYQPYLAFSVSDFWRRWHLTLGLWVRRHVYIPLGGSRVSHRLVSRNLLIAMFLVGLWHGFNWQYLVWGGLHGLALVVERSTGLSARKDARWALPRWLLTQNFLILTWSIFFWK